jgi:hypothetical protein
MTTTSEYVSLFLRCCSVIFTICAAKLSDEADRNLTADQKELLNQGSKKATLSSQEYLSVRGNEQRTMLMQKLMKGRMHSAVVILK